MKAQESAGKKNSIFTALARYSNPHDLNAARHKWSAALNSIHYKFCRKIASAFKQTRGHSIRKELHMEQFDIIAYRISITTRAKLINTKVGLTIEDAKAAVLELAKEIKLRVRSLRSHVHFKQLRFSPIIVIDREARQ